MWTVLLLVFGLVDFDDLHAQQLDLCAAVLQHLLGCRQHLPVLENKTHNSTNLIIRACDVQISKGYFTDWVIQGG